MQKALLTELSLCKFYSFISTIFVVKIKIFDDDDDDNEIQAEVSASSSALLVPALAVEMIVVATFLRIHFLLT